MNSPLVSIIVPVFNTEKTLHKCVLSLLNQTLKEIEIILVDDGSLDGSASICDSYLSDDRVHVIHKENGGLSSARNAGINISRGAYIGFVDSDDYVDEDMFEALYKRITSDKSELCICAHYTVDEKGNCVEHYLDGLPSIIEKEDILKSLIFPLIGEDKAKNIKSLDGFVWRNIYKRDLLISHPFKSERVYFAEDVVSDLEIYSQCNRISILNRCLYYYRYNTQSLSNCYRPNVHVLLNNLLEFEEKFIKENELSISCMHRLYATGIKFSLFSIHNINKSQMHIFDRCNAISEVFEQSLIRKSIESVELRHYSTQTVIYILLCRFKLFLLVSLLVK